MTNTFTTMGIVAGALISLGVLLSPLFKKIKRFMQWMERFMRDWEGEEASPGRDRVPGVMERLNSMDGELSQNGGYTTVKDRVDRLYENQTDVMSKQDMLLEAFVEMGERLIAIENCLNKPEVTTTTPLV
ncbi:hypothetical protein UFOVP1033_141 [uncultured Caudovirales phage]|uniref:Uncharacterized protein n=1 Tax=uncultured Caudovirales phage TaxID=2100421 RepID=A0A6J5Q7I4_9CAUD|nr:hypothetical protein UFOVP1033_141 [uncultured Caudovirales phage]CAB4221035.1 hypothetical protein UFOVP1631_141 [uncultured Caudovirales phage]